MFKLFITNQIMFVAKSQIQMPVQAGPDNNGCRGWSPLLTFDWAETIILPVRDALKTLHANEMARPLGAFASFTQSCVRALSHLILASRKQVSWARVGE